MNIKTEERFSISLLPDMYPPERQLETPQARRQRELFFSYDMHGVLQDRTVVSVTESLSKQFGIKEPWLFHLYLFGETPEELKNQMPEHLKNVLVSELIDAFLSNDQKEYLKNNTEITDVQHIANAFEAIGFSKSMCECIGEEVFDQYADSIALNQDMLDIIAHLTQQGYKVGVTTDRLRLAFAAAKRKYLDQYFNSVIISSHETGVLKSDEKRGTRNFNIFRESLIKMMGFYIYPDQIIHIDDGFKNNENAQKAGLKTLHYVWKAKDEKHENSDTAYFENRLIMNKVDL